MQYWLLPERAPEWTLGWGKVGVGVGVSCAVEANYPIDTWRRRHPESFGSHPHKRQTFEIADRPYKLSLVSLSRHGSVAVETPSKSLDKSQPRLWKLLLSQVERILAPSPDFLGFHTFHLLRYKQHGMLCVLESQAATHESVFPRETVSRSHELALALQTAPAQPRYRKLVLGTGSGDLHVRSAPKDSLPLLGRFGTPVKGSNGGPEGVSVAEWVERLLVEVEGKWLVTRGERRCGSFLIGNTWKNGHQKLSSRTAG